MKNILKYISNVYKRRVEYERQMMQLRALTGRGNDFIEEVDKLYKWAREASIHTPYNITFDYVADLIKEQVAIGRNTNKALELTESFLKYKLAQ